MIGYLRHLFSYFFDIQIDYRSSEINDDLIVFLSKGRYQLCSANAIYSFEDRYDNFGNIFRDHLDLDLIKGNKVLVLGLGLGSVPIILDRIKKAAWDFTTVEIDEAVCELASLYGYPKIFSPIDTVIADAVIYMEACEEKFDLICVDLFVDDIMPTTALEIVFLNNLKRCLNEGGVVVSNTLAYTEDHQLKSQSFFDERYRAVFPDASLIHTHLNYMLVSEQRFLK